MLKYGIRSLEQTAVNCATKRCFAVQSRQRMRVRSEVFQSETGLTAGRDIRQQQLPACFALQFSPRSYHTIPIIDRAREHKDRLAVISPAGNFSYTEILSKANEISKHLLVKAPQEADKSPKTRSALAGSYKPVKRRESDAPVGDLCERRVVFLCPSDETYVTVQWGIWMSGGVAVPVHTKQVPPEIEYVVQDSGASTIVSHSRFADTMRPIAERYNLRYIQIDSSSIKSEASAEDLDLLDNSKVMALDPLRRAMIVYTSGTTGKPKGVVHTHQSVQYMIKDLVDAWEWEPKDHILHFLPLHHVHGIVNKLLCPLWTGATVEFMPSAAAIDIWRRLAAGDSEAPTLFMAVPTIYMKLLEAIEELPTESREAALSAVKNMRVMVSGSAPCPVSIIERWEALTTHRLLERYGMTEIGMALSNPLKPVNERYPGYVGRPLPSVSVRLVDSKGVDVKPGEQGDLRVKGKTVFKEYWQRSEETKREFDDDGWFKTGDVGVYDSVLDSYRIEGRASIDIIKSGGYKISALEIERTLLEHPAIAECYVVGIEDEMWGERVAAIVRTLPGMDQDVSVTKLRRWSSERLATYKIPTLLKVLDEIPKNAMGKVNKKSLKSLWLAQTQGSL